MKKKICALLGIVLGIVFPFLPISGLDINSKIALGVLLWAICWWVGNVLPDYVTALFMAVMFIVLAGVPSSVVFSPFSNSTWWLLMAAFGLSLGITKSGLMKRISLYVLKLFPATFSGQVLGLLTVGTITAPFIPSLSAKAAMLSPLALGISQSMGYEERSKESGGLFLAMLTGLRNPAPLFISASVLGYAILGQFPAEISAQYTMTRWFIHALPWFVVVTLLNYLALLLIYKPKNEAIREKQSLDAKLHELGPMDFKEKNMLVVVILTMLLWLTEDLLGLESHVIAILALCFTAAGKIYDRKSFNADMSWDSIIFIGVVLGLASVFSYLGINNWIVNECRPVFEILAGSVWLLVLGVGLLTVLLRFVIVSELAYTNLFLVFAVPLTVDLGINPWIIGFAVYALVNPWFFMYQNPVYMAAYHAADGRMIGHGQAAKYCFIYILICLAGLVVSIPYWMSLGVFYI